MRITLLLCGALALLTACSGPEPGIGPLTGVDRVVVTEELGNFSWSGRRTTEITDREKLAALTKFIASHDREWVRDELRYDRGDARLAFYSGGSLQQEVVLGKMHLAASRDGRSLVRYLSPGVSKEVRALWDQS